MTRLRHFDNPGMETHNANINDGPPGLWSGMAILLILSCACPTRVFAGEPAYDSSMQAYAISNEIAAFDMAIAYLGFKKLPEFSEKNLLQAGLSKIENIRTPFVAEHARNNEVWTLKFADISLVGHFGEVMRDFEIILDPRTGQLLSVYSLSDDLGSSDTLPEPDAALTEEILKKYMQYDGLPEHPPKTTLVEAFRQCTMIPEKAKIIRAFYINYHVDTIAHNDTWIIILRGTEVPMQAHGPGASTVPINQRNSLLYSIDSETGLLEYVTNAPQDVDLIKRLKGIER